MTTTRVPNGITTSSPNGLLGDFILPSPLSVHMFMDDFDFFDMTDDWNINVIGSGTVQLSADDGGVLEIVNSSSDNDSLFVNKNSSFLIEPGKKVWFEGLFSVNEAVQSDFIMGLNGLDGTPLVTNFAAYFRKDDETDIVNFVTNQFSPETITPIGPILADTFTRLGYFFDGERFNIFVDDVFVTQATSGPLPLSTMGVSFGIQNGAASSTRMDVDYIFAAKER